MRIGMMTLSLKRGGAERVAATVAQYLSGNHECCLILFDGSTADYGYAGPCLDLHLPERKSRNTVARIVTTLRALGAVKRLKRRDRFDVLLSSLEPANVPNALVRGEPGVKTVLWVHEDKSCVRAKDLQRRLADHLIRALYNRADLIIAVSQGIRHTLIEQYHVDPDKVRVVYNPLDTDGVRAAAEEPLEPQYGPIFERPTVVTMGRLTFQKGQWHLLRAFQAVHREVPDVRLVILGDGERRAELEGLSLRLGLADRVFFLGFQSNPFKFIRRSSLFVLSSLWEGLPNVILEGLAVGIPMVCADCRSGPREILAPTTDFTQVASAIELADYGVLVPPMEGNVLGEEEPATPAETLLKQAMVKVLLDPSLAAHYSRQGPRRAVDFRMDVALPAFERTLRDVVDGVPEREKLC